jgi:hypothetical protein
MFVRVRFPLRGAQAITGSLPVSNSLGAPRRLVTLRVSSRSIEFAVARRAIETRGVTFHSASADRSRRE